MNNITEIHKFVVDGVGAKKYMKSSGIHILFRTSGSLLPTAVCKLTIVMQTAFFA